MLSQSSTLRFLDSSTLRLFDSSTVIIAIDGPAGSGKSTTARGAARRLDYLYLDTGAMYRAVALAFLRADAPPTAEAARRVLPDLNLGVRYDDSDGAMRVLLGAEDVSEAIRTQAVGQRVSRVSTLADVREKLVAVQRRIAREQTANGRGVVLDGRDIGTVVFPEAPVKIFMVAEARERARRRQAEMEARGEQAALDDVLADIEARDRADRERALAPLQRAPDAVELDTTRRSIDEQVDFVIQVVERVRERTGESSR